MKVSIFTTLIVTGALACSLTLTGCNEKTAKVELNNWNCRDEMSSSLLKRADKWVAEGKIKDSSLFVKKCQENKLGVFNEVFRTIRRGRNFSEDKKKLFAQWQKEAGVNPNDY